MASAPSKSPSKALRPAPPYASSPKAKSPDKSTGSPKPRPSPNGSRNSSPSKESRKHGCAPEPEGWRTWQDLAVRIDAVPADVTTENLWDWFSPEGEIVFMDLFQGQKGISTMSARVRFDPPPKRPFWTRGVFHVNHPKHPAGIELALTVSQDTHPRWMTSHAGPDQRYPARIKVEPRSFEFGSMVASRAMKAMKAFESSTVAEPLKVEFDSNSKRLSVFFPVATMMGNRQVIRRFKFIAEISAMKTVFWSTADEEQCALVIPLPYPPQYYWKKGDGRSTVSAENSRWTVADAWHRITDITEKLDVQMLYPVAIHNDIIDPGYMDIGRWTTFRIVLDDKSEQSKARNRHIQMALEDCNVNIDSSGGFQVTPGDKETVWTYLDHPPIMEGGSALALLKSTAIVHLPFEVRYQLEVCVSRGILSEHAISVEFLNKLAALAPVTARLRLEYLVDQAEPVWDPMSLFANPEAEAYFPNVRIPHYCGLARKATITPTTIRYSSPAVETSNRVIRKYSHVQDRFLRVQFGEENEGGRIGSSTRPGDDEIWKRVLRTLYRGIRIGDRLYEFLAFGNSQLRLAGAYFFCPTNHISCDSIRKWMGDFDHIKIVAKYSARLGQCLSTTREIRGIYVPTIRAVPDIEKDGSCFTDGVGMISKFLATIIIEEMALDIFDEPGAFQFRMGGCKGVLAVWPQATGMEVYVRASQEKFKAEFNGLEIIRCAKFASATLNRQTITILECLGVPTRAFTGLLDQQLRGYQKALTDNAVAIDLFTRFVDENQTTLILAEFLKAGFRDASGLQEPFVVNVVNLWRSWSLKLLKEKARIQVEKSAFVLGCVDETRTLRGHSTATEGSKHKDVNKLPQIFLQTSDPKNYNKTNIVKGVCIVGRNPSLHPGDIRVVQAVDNPKLHHLKDVVVFPAKGDRPVPNMLSGGDLDGDDFFVIWDASLRPSEWNHPPMNYTGPDPVRLDRDVNVDDLRNFFVNYMKNDVLGLIAHAHLGLADEKSPKSQSCLRLAELHSKAVDYPKTGEPAEWSVKFQPRKWPHFMEKKSTYKSHRALGVIYDRVVRQSVQFLPDWERAFDQRILARYHPLSDEILAAARRIKTQYDTAVRRTLAQQNLNTEFELWTGFAMSRPTLGSDYKRQEDLGREYDAMRQRFREMCYEAAGGSAAETLDPFVAAMYKVTEEEIKIALAEYQAEGDGDGNVEGAAAQPRQLDPKSMPLISFPWIFHWVMIRIALGDKYSPKNSRLAVARRKGDAGVLPQATAEKAGEKADQAKGQAEDAVTRLPGGALVHRGQPLALFQGDEHALYEPDTTGRRSESDSEAGEEGDAIGGGQEADDECAMDRLAKLVDLGDD